MKFWQNSGYHYQDMIGLSEDKLILLINVMTREDLIEWLSWNDPNGIYYDEQSLKELGNILLREDGTEIFLRQVEENRIL